MNNILYKPYLIFWVLTPILISIGITNMNSTLDINIHDTYFIIDYRYIAYLTAILFTIIGFGYWIMIKFKCRLSKWLNLIHIVLTISGILAIWVSLIIFKQSNIQSENQILNGIEKLNLALIIFILIILIGQVFYLANIIRGLFRKRHKTSG